MTWDEFTRWLESWNDSQGFWAAMQGVGTLLAAIAALIALLIARSQLSELIRSNKLLAASNEAMTDSNIAITRPYVVVDFAFRHEYRSNRAEAGSIDLKVENIGRSLAKNLTLKVEPRFPVMMATMVGRFDAGHAFLNQLFDGKTVIKSLAHDRPLVFYFDDPRELLGDHSPVLSWTVEARYEDGEGRGFRETFELELSHWRLGLVVPDPLHLIAANVHSIGEEIEATRRRAEVRESFVEQTRPDRRLGRPRIRRPARRRS
jgi:hypothetical protein